MNSVFSQILFILYSQSFKDNRNGEKCAFNKIIANVTITNVLATAAICTGSYHLDSE